MRTRFVRTSALTTVLMVASAAFMLAIGQAAAFASVGTDQTKYHPGDTVSIAGDQMQAGEAVSITITDGNSSQVFSDTVNADSSGAFQDSYTIPMDATSDTDTVTAFGQDSGASYQSTFNIDPINCVNSNALGNQATSNVVQASFTNNGPVTSYSFTSNNEGSNNGVPGLIDYCVYAGTPPTSELPVSGSTSVVGNDGTPWEYDTNADHAFGFTRPGGNPTNVPLDGTTVAMGNAQWSGNAPAAQVIVLHINDPAACQAAYPNNGAVSTCFVTPGTGGGGGGGGGGNKDLTVSKTAAPSFKRTFAWTIAKAVDKTTIKKIGGTATFNYTVTVGHDAGTDSYFKVTGNITVSNPNAVDFTGVDVADVSSIGGNCTLIDDGTDITIPANDSVVIAYKCVYGTNPGSDTDTATATWDKAANDTPDNSASGTAGATFGAPTNLVDETIAVNDTYAGSLGTVSVGDANPTLLTYSRTVDVPVNDCVSYDNTATFTTNDTGTTDSAGQTVQVCGPAKTGALTMGFWKNTNGQNLIKQYCGNLGPYLSGLGNQGPFSDAPASCSGTGGLASYVTGVINGASATNMNKMLKAQMMATALDVWFSGPGWTATKSGGIKPPSQFLSHNNLGTFKMDTTAICPMVDNLNTGTATCKNNTPSTNAVTAGAVPLPVMSMNAILNHAATAPAPFNGQTGNGSSWYNGNKTTEEVLKNIFDQFNNEEAFGQF
jgi:hypothetical protein